MSDGNFNRNLLPYHNYQSGLRAGRAQARTKALEVFRRWCETRFLAMEHAEIDELCADFKRNLDEAFESR